MTFELQKEIQTFSSINEGQCAILAVFMTNSYEISGLDGAKNIPLRNRKKRIYFY